MSTLSCPSAEQLDDLRANRLSAEESETLRQHLRTCPECIARTIGRQPSSPYPFLSPPRGPGELGWLDDHRIIAVLGEGGMAIVFEAEDTDLHRTVALKVLRPELCDEVTRQRFLREARIVASLPHDHIVTVYQVGEVNGMPYLTMERLAGQSLETRLQKDRWLPLAEAMRIAREAAEGLVVAHVRGLVHRDIKPANIWLEERDGRFRRVKLIDFGIARQMTPSASLTSAGQVLGTPLYMAPEQAAGLPVDGRADLYSLGCVLYHALTGRAPFDGRDSDTIALLQAVIKGDAPEVASVAPQLPPAVAQLIQELLARKPEDRPRSAAVLVERLRRLEQDECRQGAAPPSPPRPTLAKRIGRRPGILGILLGTLAISAAILVSAYAAYHKFWPHNAEDDPVVPAGPPLKIGILHSQTGTVSVHERPILHATQLAIDEINKAGGVLGRPLEPLYTDGASDEAVFAQAARELIEEKQVAVLFGCWTSSSRKRVAEVCVKHDRLLFYPAGYEGLENSPNVVYLGGTPNQTVIPLVRWAYADAGKRRFFLVGSEYVYSHAIAPILKREITRLGGIVSGESYVLLGETDFDKTIKQIKESKADIILNSIDGQSNLAFAKALRGADILQAKVPTVWFAIAESELPLFRTADMVGDYSAGCYFSSLSNPENLEFLKQFRARFGPGEPVNDVMQTAYAGVHLWKKAVETAGSPDTDAVRKVLPGLSVEAPAGLLKIGAKLHAYRTAYVGEITAGSPPYFRIVHNSPGPLPPEPFPDWKSEEDWKKLLHGLYVKWGNKWEKHK